MPGRGERATTTHEVVWISHKHDQTCDKCGKELGRGNIVQLNRTDGLRCATCAGYADLCFLPAGDAKLTRLATAMSSHVVIVVKWSNTRKRHERQGILVDDRAYDAAVQDVQDRAASPRTRSCFRVIDMDGEKVLWKD